MSLHEMHGSGGGLPQEVKNADLPVPGQLAEFRDLAEGHMNLVQSTFWRLGLLINEQKSTLSPIQRIEFIAAVLGSNQARASIPESHFRAIKVILNGLRNSPSSQQGAA